MRDDFERRVIAEARLWLGTPFRHQGRLRGHGVDCIGLLIGVARALDLEVFDSRIYRRKPEAADLVRGLEKHLVKVPEAEMRPADILRLDCSGLETHCALVTDRGILHAYAPARKVVEHRYDGEWPGTVVDVWRWPEAC